MAIPVPTTPEGKRGLAAILDDPDGALLAFDFDGVLSPIVEDPENAPPHPKAVSALARIAFLVGAVAVVTGRPASVVTTYLDGQVDLDGLVVFGQYGRERWDPVRGLMTPPVPPGVAAVRAELPALLADAGAESAFLEDKGGAVAVHTRRAPDPQALLTRLAGPVGQLAARYGLLVEPGRLVLELRPPGVDKGATLLAYAEERRSRSVTYTGDDLGDLPAFAAIEALRARGVPGLKVGSGSLEVHEISERADLVVDGPAGVVELLDAIADALMARH